jgi:putative ABC transport system permease protein
MVSVRYGVSTNRVKTRIEGLMRERRRVTAGKEDNFYVRDMKEIIETVTGTTRVMTALLGAVAGVSLLVGGIGIMNIMLVSVTERTREIGIRLAIGALERDVLLQFLMESVVLSSFGGVCGILLGLVTAFFSAQILRIPFVWNGWIVLISFVFTAAVGIIFGYVPARKAACLDPIEALRHE